MANRRNYESPQAMPDGLATPQKGGKMPDKRDIQESANARAQRRHTMKKMHDDEAATLFPGAGSGEVLDKAGVDNSGYIVKKGLNYGVDAMYNTLPPGMDIEDQENADVRTQPYLEIVDLGYPGDGWSGKTKGNPGKP